MRSIEAPAAHRLLEALWSRRAVLGGLAALSFARAARSAQLPAGVSATRDELPDLHVLVERTSFGITQELWLEALARGYDGFLEWQLDAANISDATLDARLAAYPSLGLSARQLQDAYVVPGNGDEPARELRAACVLRAVLSKRQLNERLVELWSDHFNIDHAADECRVLLTPHDRDVLRAHALGNFPDLLRATAHSGAMLFYLDGYSNQAAGVNENYARELMELHTLSPGHYTETDVRELAHVLTGWTIWRQGDPAYGTFRFRPDWHATTAHVVLGRTYGPNGGQADGESVLDHLATHAATVESVARKLCRRFLAYDPPKSVVLRVAHEYLRTGGDVKSLLRAVFRREHVHSAGLAARPKLKRPFHFVVSLLRATNASVGDPDVIADELALLGQVPYLWGAPDGYPDDAEYWGTAILPRWDFASRVFAGSVPGVAVHVGGAFQGVTADKAGVRCSQIFAGGHFSDDEVQALSSYATSFPAFTLAVQREVLALAASCPSFQSY
ncbi:MAG: DUF1800 domain-containing protein [Planctomycetota bacterium]